jgi:hypothetical protein
MGEVANLSTWGKVGIDLFNIVIPGLSEAEKW